MDCKTNKSCSFFKKSQGLNFIKLNYRIDLYFHEYKLAIEIDQLGHTNRNINNEIERQKA